MDKLQWFKFTPSDWMMGKIQRCDEVTQARFIRLCCLYWNKECELSIEDAIIEIDKNHFDILVAKKIFSTNDFYLNISFLDEQFLEIRESSIDKSKSGIIGNLKRWHPIIYNRFSKKEISLEDAILLSKNIAEQSHTDSEPIAEQSLNIADKSRVDKTIVEKIRKDKEIPEFFDFLIYAKEKEPSVLESALKNKYDAWIENDWRDGNNKKIEKWKVKLLNTLAYIEKEKSSAQKEKEKFDIN